jgi:hypothetical protein
MSKSNKENPRAAFEAEQAERVAKAVATIMLANEVLTARRSELLPDFEQSFHYTQVEALRVAKALSSRFKHMSVQVTFEDGQPIVRMAPVFKPFRTTTDSQNYYIDQEATAAEKASAADSGYWPTRAQVQSYLDAFTDGVKVAKEEFAAKEREEFYANGRRHGMHPFFMMGGPPWGG